MAQISVSELPYDEQTIGEYLAFFFDTSVDAGDTTEVYTHGYSNFLVYLKADGAVTVSLEAVSPVGKDYDAEYGIDSFIPIEETVKSFDDAGSDIVDLNEVITVKKALKANFLRFKFDSTVTASFAVIGKVTPAEAKVANLDLKITTLRDNIKDYLSRVAEFSVATGDATGGSTTTLEDTDAVWEVNKWADAVVEITDVSADKHYYVTVTSNTADTLTFSAIAVSVAAGDHYEIRMPLRLADIDRWGGTALTGRDISSDLSTLDLAQTALRDAICAAGVDAKTLNDLNSAITALTKPADTQTIGNSPNLDLAITDLRDAIVNTTTPKDLLDIFNQLAATLSRNTAQWGGTTLTGRDISGDLANLDLALTAHRDAITAAGVDAKTLNDLYTRLAETLSRDTAKWGGTALTGRDISGDLANLDKALSAIEANQLSPKTAELYGADETVAQSITLNLGALGRTTLEVHASATAATDFTLEVSADGTNWFTIETASAVASYSYGGGNAMQYTKISSAAAGAAGDTVSLVISAMR